MNQSRLVEITVRGAYHPKGFPVKNIDSKTSARQFNQMVEAVLAAKREVEDNPWGPTPDQQRAHDAAHRQLELARDQLREALADVPWGRHGSTVFVTNRALRVGDPDRQKTLYLNGLPRATVNCTGRRDWWLSEVLTTEEGREIRDQVRAERRIVAEIYMTEREQLLADLESHGHMKAAPFGNWQYYDGQMGGVFFRQVSEGRPIYIAAHSALRAVWGSNWNLDGVHTF